MKGRVREQVRSQITNVRRQGKLKIKARMKLHQREYPLYQYKILNVNIMNDNINERRQKCGNVSNGEAGSQNESKRRLSRAFITTYILYKEGLSRERGWEKACK